MARLLRVEADKEKPKIDLNQFFDLDELKSIYVKVGEDRFQIAVERDGMLIRSVSTIATRLQIIPSSSNTIYVAGVKF